MADDALNEVIFEGFGVKIGAKGAAFLALIFLAPMAGTVCLGWLAWQIGIRHESAVRESAQVVVVELAEVKGHLHAIRQEGLRNEEQHKAITGELAKAVSNLAKLACASWYAPAERTALRLKLEQHPKLVDLYCP